MSEPVEFEWSKAKHRARRAVKKMLADEDADLSLDEFVLTSADAEQLQHALDNGLARPRFALPEGRVVFVEEPPEAGNR